MNESDEVRLLSYLYGEVDEQERKAMDTELATDQELSERMQEYSSVLRLTRRARVEGADAPPLGLARLAMQQVEAENASPRRVELAPPKWRGLNGIGWRWRLSAAASAMAGTLTVLIWLSQRGDPELLRLERGEVVEPAGAVVAEAGEVVVPAGGAGAAAAAVVDSAPEMVAEAPSVVDSVTEVSGAQFAVGDEAEAVEDRLERAKPARLPDASMPPPSQSLSMSKKRSRAEPLQRAQRAAPAKRSPVRGGQYWMEKAQDARASRRLEAALTYLDSALKAVGSSGSQLVYAEVWLLRAEIYVELGRHKQAVVWAKRASTVSEFPGAAKAAALVQQLEQ